MGRMQFSLRMLFAAVAVVAIGAALWVAKPSWQNGAVEVVFVAWTLTSAAMGSANSTGKTKAFWMGVTVESVLPAIAWAFLGSFGASTALVRSTSLKFELYLEILSQNFRLLLLAWAFAPVVGLLCVLTHRLLVRPASAERKD